MLPKTMLSTKSEATLRKAIEEYQLDSLADEIIANAVDCYALVLTEEDDYSEVGNTRLGGDPDLPPGVEWPTGETYYGTRYGNFIAQVNFAELPPLPVPSPLPKQGLLSLFVLHMDGASDPVQLAASYYDGPLHRLSRRDSPPVDQQCNEYLVDLVPHRAAATTAMDVTTFPKSLRERLNSFFDANKTEGIERLHAFREAIKPDDWAAQLLGFGDAANEQENLYRQVVLGRLNQRKMIYSDYWDSLADYEAYIEKYKNEPRMYDDYLRMRPDVIWLDEHRAQIASLVNEWRLLLRLNSNSELNLCINDFDPLYVFIRDEDLRAKKFDDLAGEVTQG